MQDAKLGLLLAIALTLEDLVTGLSVASAVARVLGRSRLVVTVSLIGAGRRRRGRWFRRCARPERRRSGPAPAGGTGRSGAWRPGHGARRPQPSDTANPNRALTVSLARRTGRKCAQVSHGPGLSPGARTGPARPRHTGTLASVVVAQLRQSLATARRSVTCGRGGGVECRTPGATPRRPPPRPGRHHSRRTPSGCARYVAATDTEQFTLA